MCIRDRSYPLGVAWAAAKFPELGLSDDEIRKVVFENAFDFFSQSPKFKLED